MEDRQRHVKRTVRWRCMLRVLLLGLVVAVAVLAHAPSARANDVARDAERLFTSGQYEQAANLYLLVLDRAPNDPEALIGLAKIHVRRGAYEDAANLLNKAASLKTVAVEAKVLQGKLAVVRGEYAAARKHFEAALKKAPKRTDAMIGLGQVLMTLGKHREADRIFNRFIDLYNSGAASSAEALTHIGVATRTLELFQDANTVLTEARDVDPKYIDAYLEAGFLFLEKYNQRDADLMFTQALEIDPSHPLAHVGMAQVFIDSDFDFTKATASVNKALAVNPRMIEALNVRIRMALTNQDLDTAFADIKQVLDLNPNHLETLTLKATAYYLADDDANYRTLEKRVLKLNPRYAAFYATVAHFGELAHRYDEIIGLYKKALKIDKNYWRAFVGLGIAYTRVGDDKQGFSYLEKAFNNDPYNVRAYNMVELYEKTLTHYHLIERDGVRLRLHKDERPVLERFALPLIDGALSLYQRVYGFEPHMPVSVEIFHDATSFSVRSVGLPAISPQGVCFGKLVTARSPSAGDFNWAQVLWHELAHVFHLQMSKGRVPRWFTEGLAEYETVIARKEWRREQDIELYLALKQDTLLGIQDLNGGFLHAQSVSQIVVAYYQSTLVIQYLDETYGRDKLNQMLLEWGNKRTTEDIFKTVLATSFADFDTAFKAWLTTHLAYLDKSFELDIDAFVEQHDTLVATADAQPTSADAQADAGFAKLFRRDFVNARSYLERALELEPNNLRGNYLGGVLSLREGDYEEALRYYTKLNRLGTDGYTIQIEQGFLNLKMGAPDQAIVHYNNAKRFYPRGEEPFRELAKLYQSRGDTLRERTELEALIDINQHDIEPLLRLLALAEKEGDMPAVLRFGQRALDINPFLSSLHLSMGRAALTQDDGLVAELAFESYHALEPKDPFPAYVGLARTYLLLQKPKRAREFYERARALQPQDTEVQDLAAKLKP